jgi:hypothetical protein
MKTFLLVPFAILLLAVSLLSSSRVAAHCDTVDGPVAAAARDALQRGEVTPVLKWVNPSGEGEVRAAFDLTLRVRRQGEEARQLADRFFLETLVRIHRAGEGEPFTGLKPAGTIDPAFQAADRALQEGTAGALVESLTRSVHEGIRHRFNTVMERRRHAEDSIEAGRAFVAAYVDYAHFVEAVLRLSSDQGETHHGLHPAK